MTPPSPALLRVPLDGAGVALHVPGDGPTVVLVHGASGCAETWAPTVPAWAPADVWAVDLPGRGHGRPLGSVPALAAWLAAVIRDAGWQAPVLVGHSLGGAVCLQLALDHPDHVGGIVLAASASRLRVAPAILDAVAHQPPGEPMPLDFAFAPGTPRAVVDDYARRSRDVPPAAALADWQACDAFDVRARLGEVSVPALVVFGDQDALTVPKYQRPFADALPGGTAVEIPGTGHMLPWEAPAALARAVLQRFG